MKVLRILLLLTVALSAASAAQPANAQESSPGVQVADLQQQLESKLKARRDVEFAFIARVVDHVEAGELPASLVRSTMMWAKRKNKNIPFPYFHRAIIILAERIDVVIKP